MRFADFLLKIVIPFLAGGLCWHLFMHWLVRDQE